MPERHNVVKRYPFASFVILSFLLSWWPPLVPPVREFGLLLLPHGPPIAALAVTAIVGGRSALRSLASRMLRWRVGLKGYAFALGGPVLVALIPVALNVLLGAPAPAAEQLRAWPQLIPRFFLWIVAYGSTEELGWRGFAQHHLQRDRSPLAAALIIGVVGVIWHLPLFLVGDTGLRDVPGMLAVYVLFAWLFNSTGGSALLVMLSHTTNNTLVFDFSFLMFQGADSTRLWVMWSVMVLGLGAMAAFALARGHVAGDTSGGS